ncbi:hypothetical protein BDZ45DRAFT_676352 [Acephala macrosclerotiorum]|nr:hypothetical protein BDZ45DRAFT_676352 [Acephala macrosclerotiorum]
MTSESDHIILKNPASPTRDNGGASASALPPPSYIPSSQKKHKAQIHHNSRQTNATSTCKVHLPFRTASALKKGGVVLASVPIKKSGELVSFSSQFSPSCLFLPHHAPSKRPSMTSRYMPTLSAATQARHPFLLPTEHASSRASVNTRLTFTKIPRIPPLAIFPTCSHTSPDTDADLI